MKISFEKQREMETKIFSAISHFYILTFLFALHSVVMEDYMHAMQRKYDEHLESTIKHQLQYKSRVIFYSRGK